MKNSDSRRLTHLIFYLGEDINWGWMTAALDTIDVLYTESFLNIAADTETDKYSLSKIENIYLA